MAVKCYLGIYVYEIWQNEDNIRGCLDVEKNF